LINVLLPLTNCSVKKLSKAQLREAVLLEIDKAFTSPLIEPLSTVDCLNIEEPDTSRLGTYTVSAAVAGIF